MATAIIPVFDTTARAPYFDADDAPATLRVPVAGAATPAAPGALVATPPPVGELSFSGSEWGSDDGFGIPSARRSPRPGDTILGFKLVTELGRGAFARVYLAHQESLANRPVALKVTSRPTREAERLARLQHTNVVPVYSVHTEGDTQIICMPYLGKVTIADLIRAYRTDSQSRHSGRKSTSARAVRTTSFDGKSKLSKTSTADSKGNPGPARAPAWTWGAEEAPPIVGDPRAVLQALSQLAEGLTHAHQRGILHLDIKPANVLLADTGEPMLLDFNLSFDAARPEREHVGGTMPYMAVEQLFDMRNRGKGVIDERTDLYGLGVMAFEMLTGEVPFPTSSKNMRDIDAMVAMRKQGPPSIRERNPAVTPAVEAIVRKLLAPEPADRYQTAEELRADIENQLNDRPLKYAREASPRERFRKWRRRNPGVPLRLAVACLIGLALGLGGAAMSHAEGNARYEAVQKANDAHAALDSIRLDLVMHHDSKARDRGVKSASELLAAYGLPGDTEWRKRPEVRRLSDDEKVALAGDLGEVMILLAQAKWVQAELRPEAERRELAVGAWKLNRAAAGCFAAGEAPPLLDRQAAAVALAAGETFQATPEELTNAVGSHSRFLEAAFAMNSGRYATAITHLERAIDSQQNHAASQFCLAYCRQQMGQYDRALERYDVAAALMPRDPRPAFQRGLINSLSRKWAQAELEFTKAVTLDEGLADAYRYRATARYRVAETRLAKKGDEEKWAAKMAEAEGDLTTAIALGAPATSARYARALVREKRGDRAGAAADREALKDVVPTSDEDYVSRGCYLVPRDPKAALADFRRAAEINPRSLPALQNQGHVLAEKLKDNEAALGAMDRVVNYYPEYAPGVAGRAVVLARAGRHDDARKEIEKAMILSDDAEILYQAACVYAITSATVKDDRAEAMKFLGKSLGKGYANTRGMSDDPDLASLRGTNEFKSLSSAAQSIFR